MTEHRKLYYRKRKYFAAVCSVLIGVSSTLTASVAAEDKPCYGPSVNFSCGDLVVSKSGRFLIHEDGTPFFYLGDTAWELFHRLNREDAERYLENRRVKGFTVIQAVAIAPEDGLNVPNVYGYKALLKTNGKFDSAKPDIKEGPNNDYWDHVDWIIDKAAQKGLYIGLVPIWATHVELGVFTESGANKYGQWLGARYNDAPNIIWILGGDRVPGKKIALWRAMAVGIRQKDERHLMTYHPIGGSQSSRWFHGDKWLDFNMSQSGHSTRNLPNYQMIETDYRRRPPKPTLDGESNYEDHPVNWKPAEGYFDDQDVRQAAYWAVFAGACGHTYGHNAIWQFCTQARPSVQWALARTWWYDGMDSAGGSDMIHLRNLMQSRPFLTRVPDQSLISGSAGSGSNHIQATKADGYAFFYIPTGEKVKVALGKISGTKVKAWWYNPRTGKTTLIGEFDNSGSREFDPPGSTSRGNDWVLVLDDASKKYIVPGTK